MGHSPNECFYDGAGLDGCTIKSFAHEMWLSEQGCSYGAYAFVDVKDSFEEADPEEAGSWKNLVEAEVVAHLVSRIQADVSQNLEVGIATPYDGQAKLIRKRLSASPNKSDVAVPGPSSSKGPRKVGASRVPIWTSDGFEAWERDIVIYSTVRSNRGSNASSRPNVVDDARHIQMNGALTRESLRYCIWVVGNAAVLKEEDERWGEFIEDARERGCFWDAREDPKIKKLIMWVNTEKGKFDCLLRNDSILLEGALWQVYFTKEFKDSIIKINSTENRQRVVWTIFNLASGKRSQHSTDCHSVAQKYMKIIHVQPSGGLNLVWSVDVQGRDRVTQIIKVWDIVENSSVARLVGRLEAGLATYPDAYLQRCSRELSVSDRLRGKRAFRPAVWGFDPSFVWSKASSQSGAAAAESETDHATFERAAVDDSVVIMKFYALNSMTARQLMTASNASSLEFLFEMSEEQAVVISDPYSCFILGRSGTGKTTVITNRLMLNEVAMRFANASFGGSLGSSSFWGNSNPGAAQVTNLMAIDLLRDQGVKHVRQIIVTLSPKLCSAIKQHVDKALRTRAGAEDACNFDNEMQQNSVTLIDADDSNLMRGIPDNLIESNMKPEIFPLVITFRKFLAMVNGSMTSPFNTRKVAKARRTPVANADRSREFHSSRRSFGRFSLGISDHGGQEDQDDDFDFSLDGSLDDTLEIAEVTFERFTACYWPRFRAELVKSFDSSVVFTEILSSIKGSTEALHSDSGRLSENDYLSIAGKGASRFDEEQRRQIYGIFRQYEKLKSSQGDYDVADFTTHLYKQLDRGDYRGVKFHFIYVDEVQDLTMAQILLFKYVCTDVERGFMFAGDTAQTIARGVNFRFQDVRALFYENFLGKGKLHRVRRAITDTSVRKPKSHNHSKAATNFVIGQHMPEIYQLRQNFRTHIGIVQIANSVVQLLLKFFPDAVDKLDAESSRIVGERPLFLEREDDSDFVTKIFGDAEQSLSGRGSCDFGAEQVILVRTDEAKRRMLQRLGNQALVMTVLECKGLEFQDVLVYNFFADSTFTKWRVVFSALEGASDSEVLLDSGTTSFPRFHDHKHRLLMSELKQLYVVVSRARQRLWFYDESPEHHEPILSYWKGSKCIEMKKLDDRLVKSLIRMPSTAEEWTKRGSQLLENKQYDVAEICFSRAGNIGLAQYAKALRIQQAGNRYSQLLDKVAAEQHFREAAHIFYSLAKYSLAARCYFKQGDYKTAGETYRDKVNPPELEHAGDCFFRGELWEEAAHNWRSVTLKKCLLACQHGKLVSLGLEVLNEWEARLTGNNAFESLRQSFLQDVVLYYYSQQNVTEMVKFVELFRNIDQVEVFLKCREGLRQSFLEDVALYYHGQQNTPEMVKFVELFRSIDQKEIFLQSREYFRELLKIEEREGNFLKAAECAEEVGDMKHACVLLAQLGSSYLDLEKALSYARFEMLWSNGKRGWPLVHTNESQKLLHLANKLALELACNACALYRNDNLLEVHILWSVGKNSQSIRIWDEARMYGSRSLQLSIIVGRQIIDDNVKELQDCRPHANTQRTIGRNFQNDLARLYSAWEAWSGALISLVQANSRAQIRYHREDERLLKFSRNYFGAMITHPKDFWLPDSNASWLKDCKVTVLRNRGRACQVNCQDAFVVAEKFWAAQLHDVSVSIKDALEKVFLPSDNGGQELDNFRWIGNKFCIMYRVTELLAEISSSWKIHGNQQQSHLEVRAKMQNYESRIYDTSFPSSLNAGDLNVEGILWFRHVVADRNIYESIATHMVHNSGLSGDRLEAFKKTTRLQILFPLLTKQWTRKYCHSELRQLGRPEKTWYIDLRFQLLHASLRVFGHPAESVCNLVSGQDTCFGWLEKLEDYCWILLKIHSSHVYRNSIEPLDFLHLLERGIVMELACHSHMTNCLLPKSFVANHMTGKNDAGFYSGVLKLRCSQYCGTAVNMENTLHYVLQMLHSSETEFFTDEDNTHCLVFRLIAALITVLMNFGSRTSEIALGGLKMFLQSRSRLLYGLSYHFRDELRNVSWSEESNPPKAQWRAAVAKAMKVAGDPLVVFQSGTVQEWLEVSSEQKADMHFLEMAFPEYSQAVHDQTPSGDTRNGEDYGHNRAQELGHKSSAPAGVTNSDLNESTVSSRRVGEQVSICDDRILTQVAKHTSLRRLAEAREQQSPPLVPFEKHRQEASTIFRREGMVGTEYADVFRNEACPLKVEVESLLFKLEDCLQTLLRIPIPCTEGIGGVTDQSPDEGDVGGENIREALQHNSDGGGKDMGRALHKRPAGYNKDFAARGRCSAGGNNENLTKKVVSILSYPGSYLRALRAKARASSSWRPTVSNEDLAKAPNDIASRGARPRGSHTDGNEDLSKLPNDSASPAGGNEDFAKLPTDSDSPAGDKEDLAEGLQIFHNSPTEGKEDLTKALIERPAGGKKDLAEAIQKVEDAREALQKAVVALDPRNPRHTMWDVTFLQKALAEMRSLLKAGESTFNLCVLFWVRKFLAAANEDMSSTAIRDTQLEEEGERNLSAAASCR